MSSELSPINPALLSTPVTASYAAHLVARVARLMTAALAIALKSYRRGMERRDVMQLDDRALRDIGLSRYEFPEATRARIMETAASWPW
jgi:uncharacterized protein YjiS (DUF1127 family)